MSRSARCGPIALTNAVANIFNPPTTTGGVNTGLISSSTRAKLYEVSVTNKDVAAHQFKSYIGATGGSAAGTEYLYGSIPAGETKIFYKETTMEPADFLTALSDAPATLTITIDYDLDIV